MPRRLPLLCLLCALLLAPPVALADQPAEAPVPLLAPLAHGRAVELPAELDPGVPSPAEFLGYPLGSRFTHHHRILEYLERLAEASPRVAIWRYGETYEGRPLTLVAISRPENVARLDELRAAHRRLADPRGLSDDEIDRLAGELPVVVWLAYGVHGNESSSAEAAMAAAYALAAGGGEWAELLAGTVVLIDPLVNPDGRERYVSFYEQARGRLPDADPDAAEHWEPWPGGRQNHYLIDLNRDWSWASQRETRDRLAAYREWEPQVYVDYHEMFVESTYFFPPAADPVNPLLDPRTVAWLDVFGRGNAAAFDRQGWPFYKAESFDLYYPGYGDSYPAFRGAVGMTYEMAGHGRAGLAVARRDGSRLTLADRVAQHLTTSLATVRTAAENRRELLATFARARVDAAARSGPVYLWPAGAPEAPALAELLELHGLAVGRLAGDVRLRARAVTAPEESLAERSFPAGTYVVSAGQPLGALAQTLLDRSPKIGEEFLERQRARLERNAGTEFYDITSWSLPLAFNLEAWVVPAPARGLEGKVTEGAGAAGESIAPAGGAGRVGFLAPPAGIAGFRFAAGLLREKIAFRVALEELEMGGARYPAGTLFIPRLGNEGDGKRPLEEALRPLAAEAGVAIAGVDTSYSTAGISLGSDLAPTVIPPTVGLVSGEGVSATSFGFLWHLLDQQVGLPHSVLPLDRLGAAELADYDVLVLPDGWGYGEALGGDAGDALARWVREGGVLVAVGGARRWLAEEELTAVEAWKPPEEKGEDGGGGDGEEDGDEDDAVARRPIDTPGAILATRLTPHHPLAAGLPGPPPVLFSGSTVLLATGDPQVDVLTAAAEAPVLTGIAWPEAEARLEGALLVSLESAGRGAVVLFAQDPDFRLFWRGTAPLFLNAVVYGPSFLSGGGY
ncbi:MAG TPA: M14 family zinc carboxypeptidase [Thermoanaerobaculia bacterium]|nr:M14 family zinc carboxypeptidase [Thermoanaerobaculia bacterium]